MYHTINTIYTNTVDSSNYLSQLSFVASMYHQLVSQLWSSESVAVMPNDVQ